MLLLAVYYAVIGVAIASLTDRRIVAGASVIGLFLITSITARACIVHDGRSAVPRGVGRQRSSTCCALPLYLRDIVFLGHVERRSPR